MWFILFSVILYILSKNVLINRSSNWIFLYEHDVIKANKWFRQRFKEFTALILQENIARNWLQIAIVGCNFQIDLFYRCIKHFFFSKFFTKCLSKIQEDKITITRFNNFRLKEGDVLIYGCEMFGSVLVIGNWYK